MERVVSYQKPSSTEATLPKVALCALAKFAGVASYVTLVLLLTQRSPADLAKRDLNAALTAQIQSHGQQSETTQIDQQTSFVTKIINSHHPKLIGSEKLAQLIVHESRRADYDPLFVAAVIRSESTFKNAAISSRGAKGLMQLMPATSRYICNREKIALQKGQNLHDPALNIRLGIAYLKYLEGRFKGDRTLALIAYNWGPTNTALFMRGSAQPPNHSLQYAQNILSAHSDWEKQFSQFAQALPSSAPMALIG